jgi:multidrug efflux pump subunit AcrA (membrane-fusion protein)
LGVYGYRDKKVVGVFGAFSCAASVLDSTNLNLSYTAITAAIDGQVSKIDIQPGQLVQPGQSFFISSTIMKLGS